MYYVYNISYLKLQKVTILIYFYVLCIPPLILLILY